MEKDFRVRCDLTFPPERERVARGLISYLQEQMDKAVNISPDEPFEERGYVSLERCGHRIQEPCEVIKRQEVV